MAPDEAPADAASPARTIGTASSWANARGVDGGVPPPHGATDSTLSKKVLLLWQQTVATTRRREEQALARRGEEAKHEQLVGQLKIRLARQPNGMRRAMEDATRR